VVVEIEKLPRRTAVPPAPAVVAVISVVGIGILKVVEGDHDRAFLLDLSSPTLVQSAWRSPRMPRLRERRSGVLIPITTSAVQRSSFAAVIFMPSWLGSS
jgi:hypothetical protein